MRITVLGAGLLGVSTAYYLANDGHEVIVLDRQEGPARETSYATACLLTPGHTAVWPHPSAPWRLLASFWQKDAVISLKTWPSLRLMKWGLRFLGQCTSARFQANSMAVHHLAQYSVAEIGRLTAENAFAWDNVARGVVYLEQNKERLRAAKRELSFLEDAGVSIEAIDQDRLLEIEPALTKSRIRFAGALYLRSDQSGDGHKFASCLAERCRALGVEFRYGTDVLALESDADKITGIRTRDGVVQSDAYVLALGSYSSIIASTVGLDLLVCPAKGYSVTMPVLDPARAPTIGGVEEETHVTFSRLGDRVRMSTKVEFAGYDTNYETGNFVKILRVARDLFDGGVDIDRATHWACLRPASPDGPPLIGATRFANLWLNTGHGYLGWTTSCGSGRLLSDLIADRTPDIDPTPYRPSRF